MDRKNGVQLAAMAVLLCAIRLRKKRRKRLWTRSWLARRESESVYYRLLRELSLEDPDTMRQWILLDKEQYQALLGLVTPLIEKQNTNMRRSVSAGERLTLTLRYLATGETQSSLARQFRVSHNLVSAIIPEVCRAIYQVLQPLYLKLPNTGDEWRKVANDFYALWNFPMCVGSLNGKRILISKPPNPGSEFYDYQGQISVIMMALIDSDYKFMYVDVGACGRSSDGGVWDRCSLKDGLERNILDIPQEEILPFSTLKCPYVIVGNDAFPLKSYLMKPYPERDLTDERRIFNYRLSRARRVSENAFGNLAARFQVFKQPINTSPTNVKDIAFATAVLHNFLRTASKDTYSPPELFDREDMNSGRLQRGQWHQVPHGGFATLEVIARGHANDAKNVREKLKGYFNNEGSVPWQEQMALEH